MVAGVGDVLTRCWRWLRIGDRTEASWLLRKLTTRARHRGQHGLLIDARAVATPRLARTANRAPAGRR